MKTHLFSDRCFVKTALLTTLMFLMSSLIFAQKVYISNQDSRIYGICIGCSVQNPQNMIGSNEDNYSSMQIPLGALARIEQKLIFPAITDNKKVVIGIGTSQSNLSAQLLAGISVETFNGNTSNNDYKIVNNELLKIGFTNPSKGTIEFTVSKPYDRVVISLNAGLLNLNGGLRIYYAYQMPEEKTYSSSETHIASGISCTKCSIENPQNAVGPNENDYSKLSVSRVGLDRKVQQTLYFPTPKTFTKLVIGVGTDGRPISETIKKRTFIQTMNGTGDQESVKTTYQLKPDPQNPSKGTIEFLTYLPYNSVKIQLHGINDGTEQSIDDLRIYYAYQEEVHLNACYNAPYDPFYYFYFNGNTNSNVPGFTLSGTNVVPVFKNDMVCGQGLLSSSYPYSLESPDISPSLYTGDITISFWASIQKGDQGIPDPDDPDETLPPTAPQPYLKVEAFGEKFHMFHDNIQIGEELDGGHIYQTNYPNRFRHYVLVLKADDLESDRACIYIDGVLGGGSDEEDANCTLWEQSTRNTHKKIKIDLNRAQIDELIIYNKALNESEIARLTNSYVRPPNSSLPISVPSTMKAVPSEESFTVSPNPTTGQITLDGNILLLDAAISIRNTSGREVYQSPFRTKTFDLPATLPGGVYFLTLQTKDKKVYTRKIILTR